ncbi:MAG: hypothetical protein IPP14_15265 [Planctomycetes bacterium]|nr:hypothetical protein [Planctomycetota bacterium]
MFGLPYLILNGLLLLLVCGVLLFLFVMVGGAAKGAGSGVGNAIAGVAVLVLVVCLMVLGYVVVSGILCILGKVAGWWMGMIYSGLNAALQLVSMILAVMSPEGAQGSRGLIWILLGLLMHVGLIVVGIIDYKGYRAKRAAGFATPMQGGRPAARGLAAPPSRGPRPMNAPARPAPMPQAPQPLPMADTVLLHAPVAAENAQAEPVEAAQAEAAPEQVHEMTPKQAGIELLALVASCEPQLAPDRLRRASVAAGKLLGEAAQPAIQQWLSGPAQVYDIAAQLGHLMPYVAINARLAAGLLKCSSYTLKDNDGSFSAIGQQVMALLEANLSATAPAPMPAPMPAPPAMQAAPPGGARLPSQRRRRPGYR